MEAQLPTGVYLAIGILCISNFGAIISMVLFIFKCGKFVANTETGIADAKACAVRAHKDIDALKDRLLSK